jgi:hypothetical protein
MPACKSHVVQMYEGMVAVYSCPKSFQVSDKLTLQVNHTTSESFQIDCML